MLTISLMLEFSSVAYGLILKFGFIGTSLWHVAACESNCGDQERAVYVCRGGVGRGIFKEKGHGNPVTMVSTV